MKKRKNLSSWGALLLLATCGIFAACAEDDSEVTDETSDTSSSSGSSSSTSYYANTDPTTIDFTNDDINSNFTASNTTTINFSDDGVTVENALSEDTYSYESTSGYVTATLNTTGTVLKLTGNCSSGALLINSAYKFELNLSDLELTNPNGTAINIQSGHCFVVVDGDNELQDGSSSAYTDTYSTDAKSVFHSEDKLRFSGSGSLTITANNAESKHALSSDDWVVVNGPTLTLTSGSNAGQGIKVNDGYYQQSGTVSISVKADGKKGINSDGFVYVTGGTLKAVATGGCTYDDDDQEYKAALGIKSAGYVTISGGTVTATCSGSGGKGVGTDYILNMKGGTLNATATGGNNSSADKSAKGIKADGDIIIEGGSVNVTSANHEGMETKSTLTVTGGYIYAKAKDDAINSASTMDLTGGYVFGWSTNNDAIDANGNLNIAGATVYAVSTAGGAEQAIDANTEGGYKLYVTSGNLVAYPSLENNSQLTQACKTVSISSTNNWNALYNGSSVALVFKAPTTGTYIVSTASTGVTTGVTVNSGTSIFNGYGYADASVSGGSSATLSSYSGGTGGGGGFPGGR